MKDGQAKGWKKTRNRRGNRKKKHGRPRLGVVVERVSDGWRMAVMVVVVMMFARSLGICH